MPKKTQDELMRLPKDLAPPSSRKSHGTLIEHFLPEDHPKADEDFLEFYSQFNLMLTPIAFFMSYHRNQSLKWAAIHTMLAAPYVAFVLVDTFARKEAETILEVGKRAEAAAKEGVEAASARWDEEWNFDE